MSTLKGNQYDFEKDSKCVVLRDKLLDYLKDVDFKIETKNNLEIIEYIIKRFEKFLVNNNKLKRELLWKNDIDYNPETAWQQVFHTYVYEYLEQNNINIATLDCGRSSKGGVASMCIELDDIPDINMTPPKKLIKLQ